MLPSQIDFVFLSAPDSVCAHNAMDTMDLETVSQSGSSVSDKADGLQKDDYVPQNYISPEVYALLAAAEASFALRADKPGTDMDLDCNDQEPTLQAQSEPIEQSDPDYGLPSTLAAPPKRFYTTFWRSVTLRLMDQRLLAPSLPSRHSRAVQGKPSSKPGI